MALEALVHQPVQQGAAVVAEGGAGVAVGPELVKPRVSTAASVLQLQQQQTNLRGGERLVQPTSVSAPLSTPGQ